MTTSAAVIMDAAPYAQAIEDAVKASVAYYAGGDVGVAWTMTPTTAGARHRRVGGRTS